MNEQELIEALGFIRAIPEGDLENNVLPHGSETSVTSLEVVTVLVMVGEQVGKQFTSRGTLERCGDIKSFGDLSALVDQLLQAD